MKGTGNNMGKTEYIGVWTSPTNSLAFQYSGAEALAPIFGFGLTIIPIQGKPLPGYFLSEEFCKELRNNRFTLQTFYCVKEDINKWVSALRSGDYNQCGDFLAHVGMGEGDINYCSLGVYAEVSEHYSRELIESYYEFTHNDHVSGHRLCENELPFQDLFMYLNDIEGWNFAQIADFAEKFFGMLYEKFD